jgi:hypothetical protein
VYRPQTLAPNADAWRKVFRSGAETPLHITRYGLDAKRSWMHDLVVYVFDPEKPTDVIYLWNLRLEPKGADAARGDEPGASACEPRARDSESAKPQTTAMALDSRIHAVVLTERRVQSPEGRAS